MNRHNAWKRAGWIVALAILIIGCESNQVRRRSTTPAPLSEAAGGQRPVRLGSDPVSDLPGRIIVGILSAVGEPDRNSTGRTIILVPNLVNRSSAPEAGVIELGEALRGELAAAGEPSRMTFIAPGQSGAEGGANYILEGEVYAVQRQGQRYWEVFFTLFDLNPGTGQKQDRRWENTRGYLVAR